MSNEAMTWAFKVTGLTTTEKFVLVALADYADESNRCYPAIKKTAHRVAASERTVQRSIKALEAKGLLRIVAWKRENGSSTTTRYHLKVGCHPVTPGGDTSDTPSVTPMSPPGGDTHVTPLNPQLEPSDKPPAKGSAPYGAAPAITHPAHAIAQNAYDATHGALKFMAIRQVATWAIDKRGETPERVEAGIADLHYRGKPVTRAVLDQWFSGALDRGGKPSAGDRIAKIQSLKITEET